MKTVAFSFLGTQLDAGKGPERWNRWRPNVALCQQEDLLIHRLELLHDRRHRNLADRICEDIAGVSPETEVRCHLMDLRNPWDFEEVYGAMLDFTDGYDFAPERENYLANLTTGTHVAQICWFLLTEARYLPGRLIQLSPARRQEKSPEGSFQVIDLDLSRYDQIAGRFAVKQEEGTSFLKSGIATRNAAFNTMIDQIEKVTIRSKAPVLLLGPTGAGKSQLARRIFDLKKARHQIEGDFVEINCATLRGDNAMSALFGHRKGAFTGAQSDRPGLLRAADNGLLFLDEIGELGLDEQAMILRAVEEKRFLPLGSDREASSDFQLLAGTNRDLRIEARAGRFREDLFARLSLWTYELPSLRDRVEDIAPNIDYEVRRNASDSGAKISFNKEALQAYLRFATGPDALWLGNFRDLGASILRMATLSDNGRINEAIVKLETERLQQSWRGSALREDDILAQVLGEESLAGLDLFDKAQLASVLKVCRRSKNLSAAGRELFACSRLAKRSSNDADRLKKYLARFGLDWTAASGHAGRDS